MKKNGILLVLLLVLVGLVGYLIYDKTKDNNESKKEDDKDNVVQQESDSQEKVKFDEEKEYIYAANYPYDVSVNQYNDNLVTDLQVPYINVNKDWAKEANNQLKVVFEKAISVFKEGISDKVQFAKLSYNNYQNGDIMSVVVKYGKGGSDIIRYEYYTYNFNIKTGELVNYSDQLGLLNYSLSSIKEKIKEKVIDLSSTYSIEMKDQLIETSMLNYQKTVDEKTTKYYLDENNNLNLILLLENDAHTEKLNTIIKID